MMNGSIARVWRHKLIEEATRGGAEWERDGRNAGARLTETQVPVRG